MRQFIPIELMCDEMIHVVAYAHDILKERNIHGWLNWTNSEEYVEDPMMPGIPTSLKKYLKQPEVINAIDEMGLSSYSTRISRHALASAAWLFINYSGRIQAIQSLIGDGGFIYHMMYEMIAYHSCAIPIKYEMHDAWSCMLYDITMLSDKLSSNYLRINMLSENVRIDLDKLLSDSAHEGEYMMFDHAVLAAKLLGSGKTPTQDDVYMATIYSERIRKTTPFISRQINIKTLGGRKTWPKRKSGILKTNEEFLNQLYRELGLESTEPLTV